jgi:putative ABC transport system ATP-binding protein
MNDSSNLIQLTHVSKWFDSSAGRFVALKEIEINIRRGEYVTIVGKSGSGKSTLLNMVTGVDHPSEGTVIINGTELHKLKENDLAIWRGKNIGIVFQFFQLIPTLTVSENILLAMDFVNIIPKKEREQRAAMLLEQVGISDQSNKLPASMSGGQQQRAAIARALANDPSIIVADEPTGNLDSKTEEIIFGLFSELSKDNKTIIIVTHEKKFGSQAGRVITIKDGMVERAI